MKEPIVSFSKWRKWAYRARLKDQYDVPEDFGILGVYLLAISSPKIDVTDQIPHEIIYIGMSSHVTKRLDRSHKAVRAYRADSGDDYAEHLLYAEWLSEWTNRGSKSVLNVHLAYMHFVERKLIWLYASKYNQIPKYNAL